jgi:hypothetical protein
MYINVECIVVSLILNVAFLVEANFTILGFKGSTFIICFIYYCNMFCIIHINVNIFSVFTPLVKKMCNGLLGCLVFLHKISSTIAICLLLSCFIWNAKFSYGINSFICYKMSCLDDAFFHFSFWIVCYVQW